MKKRGQHLWDYLLGGERSHREESMASGNWPQGHCGESLLKIHELPQIVTWSLLPCLPPPTVVPAPKIASTRTENIGASERGDLIYKGEIWGINDS